MFQTLSVILDARDKRQFGLLVFLLFISGFLSLLGVGAILPLINALVSPNKNWFSTFLPGYNQHQILFASLVILLVVFWVKNITSYFCLRMQTKILYQMAYKLSRKLFAKYMEAPYTWHLKQSTSELVRNVVNECAVIANGVLSPLGCLFTEVITALFILILLLFIDVKFTLIVSVSLVVCIYYFMRITKHKSKKYADDRARAWMAMTKEVIQGISGIKETKIYGLEPSFIDNLNTHSLAATESSAFQNVYSQSSRFVLEAVAVSVVIFSIGVMLFFTKTIGSQIILLLSVFGVAAMQLLPSLNRLMAAISTIKYSLPALYAVNEALQSPLIVNDEVLYTKKDDVSLVFKHEVHIDNVSFSYTDEKVVLDHVSLIIPKGASVAFVGHSGSGKTTFVDVLLGLFPIQSGRILIDDVELTNANINAWRKHLGYIPQTIYLYDCTIRENVAFGVPIEKIDDEKVWEALDKASLKEFVGSLSEGLNTDIGENGIRLSGGQRQRIGIARALFRNPDVLIMDEATASLDNQTEKEVTQAIQQAVKNRTVVTIAHRLSTIKNSDIIYVMDKGKIIAQGSYDELIEHCELFKHLVCLEKKG